MGSEERGVKMCEKINILQGLIEAQERMINSDFLTDEEKTVAKQMIMDLHMMIEKAEASENQETKRHL